MCYACLYTQFLEEEEKQEGQGVQSHPQLHIRFEASLRYLKPCFEKPKTNPFKNLKTSQAWWWTFLTPELRKQVKQVPGQSSSETRGRGGGAGGPQSWNLKTETINRHFSKSSIQ